MEKEKMKEYIRNWNISNSTSEKDLLSMVYKSTNLKEAHIINMLISKKADEDYNKISEALSIISQYEKEGMYFNFINYKTKGDQMDCAVDNALRKREENLKGQEISWDSLTENLADDLQEFEDKAKFILRESDLFDGYDFKESMREVLIDIIKEIK